jgi:hypothetical protein
MTRIATTKMIATALAVASLGFAASAQADDMDQPVDNGAQAAQVEQAPVEQAQGQDENQAQDAQNIAIGEPVPGTNPADANAQNQDEEDPDPLNGPEADARFKRYCNMKDAEPSHSDKQFCMDYSKAHGTTTTTPGGKGTSTGSTSTWPKDDTTHYEPNTYKHHTYYPAKTVRYAPSSSSSSLPFTGLELWQLALLGVVLIGGGIGARRMLINR